MLNVRKRTGRCKNNADERGINEAEPCGLKVQVIWNWSLRKEIVSRICEE